MQAFDPVEAIGQIAPRPVFLMHGDQDDVVPVASAHALYERAGEPKELWLIEGLKHCKALDEAYDPFTSRVVEFFDRWLVAADHGSAPRA